jgi:hypothetical protein
MVDNLLFWVESLEIDFDGRLNPLEEKVVVEGVVLVYFQLGVLLQNRFYQLDVVAFSQDYALIRDRL